MRAFWKRSCVLILLLTGVALAPAQRIYENPHNGSRTTATYSLAWERANIEGFAWPHSIRRGETLNLYISTRSLNSHHQDGQRYDVDIYRVGRTDSLVYYVHDRSGTFQPLHDSLGDEIGWNDHSRRPVDYKRGCEAWWAAKADPESFGTSSWPSGLYYAKLTHRYDPSYVYYASFIIRPDNAGTTPLLLKFHLNTFQAYNYWGGGSLYSKDKEDPSLAVTDTIAMDRPLTFPQSESLLWYAQNFVRLLADSGYTIDFCDNIDLDRATSQGGPEYGSELLDKYKTLILWDHDEYWSEDERSNIIAFKGDVHHGNIARFAPNTGYWRIHWVGDEQGAYKQLYCVKKDGTDLWRNLGEEYWEAKFLGSQYEKGWNSITDDSLTEQPSDSCKRTHWIFRGTSIEPGEEFGLGIVRNNRRRGIVSGEVDNLMTGWPDFPVDTLAERAVYSNLGEDGHGFVLHQMVYFEDTTSSNARIFAQGAGGWTLGLDAEATSSEDRANMQRVTLNIINHFAGQRYLGKVYAASDHPLIWDQDIELDGAVEVLPGRALRIKDCTVTVDSSFVISGTLIIEGSVTLRGDSGSLTFSSNDTLRLLPDATLTLEAPVPVSIAQGSVLDLQEGSTLLIKTSLTLASGLNLTVPQGATVRVEGDGAVYMSGQWIDVYGSFTAEGSAEHRVLLDKAPGSTSWPGLYYNTGSSGSVAYAEVRHSYWGIYCDASNHTITNNLISGNIYGIFLKSTNSLISGNTLDANTCWGVYLDAASAHLAENSFTGNYRGIRVTGGGSPWLDHNEVSSSSYGAFCADGGSSPNFATQADLGGGYNHFHDNGGGGVDGYLCNDLWLGSGPYGGYNSIHDNAFAVQANSCDILAQHNYWAGDSSNTNAFPTYQGTIDHSYPLAEDPTTGSSLPFASLSGLDGGESAAAPPALGDDPLTFALTLQKEGRFGESRAALLELYRNHPSLSVRMRALGRLAVLAEMTGEDDFLALLDGELSREAIGKEALEASVERLRSQWFLKAHRASEALSVLGALRKDHANWPGITQFTWVSEALTRAYELGEMAQAERCLDSASVFLTRQEREELTAICALYSMGYTKRMQRALQGVHKEVSTAGSGETLPLATTLYAAYPNPFNPLTEIRFDLAEAGKVALKVYDIVGREVATLREGYHEQGSYRVKWDAHEKASGVYFICLTGADLSGATQWMKTGKALLVK